MLKKTNKRNYRFSPAAKVLILAAVFGSLLLIVSVNQAKAMNGYAVIDCYCDKDHAFSSIGEPRRDHNEVNTGEMMQWFLIGPTGTTVTIKFVDGNNCSGTIPFLPNTKLYETINNTGHHFDSIKGVIAPNMGGPDKCYNYEITCSNWSTQSEQSQPAQTDPIIDVPR